MLDLQTKQSTYQGWSNKETWLASLWLNNDEGSYSVLKQAYSPDIEVWERAEWLESKLYNQLECEVGEASLWCDLLSTAFYRINWVEVIEKNEP